MACTSRLCLAGAALAQGLLAFLCTSAAAGDAAPAGARERLARLGVRLDAGYTGEFVRNAAGGRRTGSAYLGLLELKATIDGGRVLGLSDSTLYFDAQRTHGDDPSALAGDAQGPSNIAAPGRWRLFEAWIERNLPAQNASLLAGRFDLNAEFYHLDTADLFLNSSFGVGPELSHTGRGGPSIFPESAIGARAEWRAPPLLLRGAVMNGVPVSVPRADGTTGAHRSGDGLLYVGEAVLLLPAGQPREDRTRPRRLRLGRAALAADRDSKLAIGAWHYTGDFEPIGDGGAPPRHGSSGAYAVGEQVLYRDSRDRNRRLRVFAQLGAGDDRLWQFASYAGAGLTLTAPLPGRRDDEAGIAFAHARNGAPFLAAEALAGRALPAAETALEITYLYTVSPHLSIQPALQRIRHPSAEPGLRDATVGMVRVELAL